MLASVESFLRYCGPWALVPIFFVVALESSAFVGLLCPGETAGLIAGVLAAAHLYPPWSAFGAVIGGAVVGDIGGYELGRHKGEAVVGRWSFARRHFQRHRSRLEHYFANWGAATVVIGRFIAVGRVFAPFTAGLSHMPARRYFPMAVLGGVLWGSAVVALGYLLGAHLRLAEEGLQSLGAGILVVFALTALTVFLWRWFVKREKELTDAWQRYVTLPLAHRFGIRVEPLYRFVRERFSPAGYLGLHLTLGLIATAVLAWLFGGVTQDIYAQDPLVAVDRMVGAVIARHHAPALDTLAFVLNLLSDPRWLAFIIAADAIALALGGDIALAATAIPDLLGAYGLALGLRILLSRVHPNVPNAHLVHGFKGFPSVTLAAVTAAYGFVCYGFVIHNRSWRLQTLSVVWASYTVVLIGLGQIYDGQLLSAVIGGFALGGCWLAICVTGVRTYQSLRSIESPPGRV
jgi:membrane protein DedA with SNARE-associated domain